MRGHGPSHWVVDLEQRQREVQKGDERLVMLRSLRVTPGNRKKGDVVLRNQGR